MRELIEAPSSRSVARSVGLPRAQGPERGKKRRGDWRQVLRLTRMTASGSAIGLAILRLKGTFRAGNWLNLRDLDHHLHSARACLWPLAASEHYPRRRAAPPR